MGTTTNGDWPETTLGEVIEIFDHKRVPVSSVERSARQGPYPYYGASGIIDHVDDYLFDGRYLLIAEDGENLKSRKTPIAFFASGKFWVNNHAHIVRGAAGRADDHFLMSYIEGSDISGYITGTAQPKLSQANLKSIRLPLPPLTTQRKIAAILSAYDDLIENNTRRIRLLEDMAQALYREWFMHFRFPGQEKVKVVESALGRIPAGWGVVRLRDITTKIGSGATPRGGKDSYKQGGLPLFRSLNVYDNRFDTHGLAFIDENQAAELSNVVVQPRDILLNITGASVARCCMAPSYLLPARVNQHVAIVRVNSDLADPYYVLSCINSESRKKQLLAFAQGGATREALTKEKVGSFEVVLPSKTIIDQFAAPVASMWTPREVLEQKNAVLRRTRDLLLPKLISGEVDVSELDVAMPEKENGNGG